MPVPDVPGATRRGGRAGAAARLLSAGLLCLAWTTPATDAKTVNLTAHDAFGSSSLLEAGNWGDGAAPRAGNDYVVANLRLRTPLMVTGSWPEDRTVAFAGDSLTITGSQGVLALKSVRTPIKANTTPATVWPKIVINDLRLAATGGYATIIFDQAYWDMNKVILAGNITLASGTAAFVLNASATMALIVESNISGAADLVVRNAGTLKTQSVTLGGNNTYSGATDIIEDAVLRLGSATALGRTRRLSLTGSSHVALDVNGYDAHVGMLAGASAIALITSRDAAAASAVVTSFASGTSTYAGRIADGAGKISLVKSGGGTLVLTGANSHTGTTAVNGGRLLLNGDNTRATGAVIASAGGALGGTGTLGGPVRVENNGTLAAAQDGALTMPGLLLDETSALDLTLGAPGGAAAPVQVNGDLTLDGRLDLTAAAGFAPGVYRIINYTGALTGRGLSVGRAPVPGAGLSLRVDTGQAGQINLVYGPADSSVNGSGTTNATTANRTGATGTDAR
jgi:autotransporter-associated beta strand protein